MTIGRLVLRLATVHALEGRTVAADRVRDSSLVDLENAISQNPETVILVYTDESDDKPNDKAAWGGKGTTDIILIIAVAGAQKMDDGTVEFSFPETDKALELTLDIVERQIQTALMDPDNRWAEVWRGLVTSITRWRSQRGASTKEGTRFAARQITIQVETVQDPVPGAPVEGEWAKFLALLQYTTTPADLRGLYEPLKALMEGKPLPDWHRTMAQLGINRDTLKGIGLAPLQFHPLESTDAPATFESITINGNDLTTKVEE